LYKIFPVYGYNKDLVSIKELVGEAERHYSDWEHLDPNGKELTLEDCEEVWDGVLSKSTPGYYSMSTVGTIYPYHDRSWSLVDLKGDLLQESIKCKLHGLEHMMGISTPYSYLGTFGSLTSNHTEDANLSSINTCYYGCKLWLIIHPESVQALNDVLDQHDSKSFNLCGGSSFHHKLMIYNIEFLKKHGIQYSFVIQRSDETVMLHADIPHAVINISKLSISEAVSKN
jgi:hypothetical protein